MTATPVALTPVAGSVVTVGAVIVLKVITSPNTTPSELWAIAQ